MENVRQDQLIESRDVWKRGLIMLLFTFAFGVGQMVLHAMAVVQSSGCWQCVNAMNIWLASVLPSQIGSPK
jgi:hypothetical protein